ncbi:MAG: hypothetical protein HKN48_10755 [Flavobacteriaceae bacterium]|nr:hypothetical protein [Flavobacteriaceae bacterium]
MPPPLIDLKQRRDIGDIIAVYFDFFKKHLKPFLNIFIRYNGLFIMGFLLVSYLMVTGFVGSIRANPLGETNTGESDLLLGLGVLGFFGLFVVVTIMNYSLAASYLVNYEKNPSLEVNKKAVWELVYNNIGRILLFILLLILLYIPIIIVGAVVSFIPVVGILVRYLIGLIFTTWMGLAFMPIFYENRDVTDSLGEGWRLVTQHFWKSVLVNFVLSILLFILLFVVLMIPGVLIGVYAFHSLENGVDLAESPFATVVWTLALCIFLVLYTLLQSMMQLGNGVLYFSVHEETYNHNARKRIEQIGAGE